MPRESGKLNAGGQWVKKIYAHITSMLPTSETAIYRACFEMDGLLPDKVDDFLTDLTKMGYIKCKGETYYLIDVTPNIETTEEKTGNSLEEWRKKQQDKEDAEDGEDKPIS